MVVGDVFECATIEIQVSWYRNSIVSGIHMYPGSDMTVFFLNMLNSYFSTYLYIYIYNSVLTCRQNIINSSASAPLNAMKIAVKKVSDVDVCMFGPEL